MKKPITLAFSGRYDPEDYIDMKGLCDLLAVKDRTIRRMVEKVLLPKPVCKCGHNKLWNRREVVKWLNEGNHLPPIFDK